MKYAILMQHGLILLRVPKRRQTLGAQKNQRHAPCLQKSNRTAVGQARAWRVQGRRHMKRSDLTEKLLDIKRENGWSWKHICGKIGGYSEVLIVGAILGQMKLTKTQRR